MNGHTLCIGLTPAVQELREFKSFTIGEVNRAVAMQWSVAGKGSNVARVLRQIGGSPLLLGFVGGETGQYIRDQLRREGVPEEMVRVRARTRVCVTIKDLAADTITELVEETKLPSPGEWRQFHASLRRHLAKAQQVVIAGALMPGAAPTVYEEIAKLAARSEVPLLIDSQREPLLRTLKHCPWIAKLNVHELENTLGCRLSSECAMLAGARKLIAAGAHQVLVTNGAKGAWLVNSLAAWHFQAPCIKPVNPIGSGDSMTAGIIQGLERGKGLLEAVRYGVACGTANALTLTAGTVHLKDVRRLVGRVKMRTIKA
jgi:tagatose 6-phosphate kinase